MASGSKKTSKPSEMLTVRKIGELAGCSPSTVSRVISGNFGNARIGQALRDKIRKICEQYNYEPNIHASRMCSKRTGIIGLVIPKSPHGLHDENFAVFMNAVYESVNQADGRLLLLMLDERFIQKQHHLTLARRREVDGLIIWGALKGQTWLDELKDVGMPFVLAVNRTGQYPCVYTDDKLGMAAMVARCKERGATRFAFLGGVDVDSANRRREAFELALGHHNYQYLQGDFSMAAGLEAAASLCKNTRRKLPHAIVCANDQMAHGMINGLDQHGYDVPKDVLVTGVDNIHMSEFTHPSISTYDQMNAQCGQTCTNSLLEYLNDGKPIKTHIIKPQIHLRGSA